MAESIFAQPQQQPIGTNPLNIGAIQPVTLQAPKELDITPFIQAQQEYRSSLETIENVRLAREKMNLEREKALLDHESAMFGMFNSGVVGQAQRQKESAGADPYSMLETSWHPNSKKGAEYNQAYSELQDQIYQVMRPAMGGGLNSAQMFDINYQVQKLKDEFNNKWINDPEYFRLMNTQAGITSVLPGVSGLINSDYGKTQGYVVDEKKLNQFRRKAELYKTQGHIDINGQPITFTQDEFNPENYVFRDPTKIFTDFATKQTEINKEAGTPVDLDDLTEQFMKEYRNNPDVVRAFANIYEGMPNTYGIDEDGQLVITGDQPIEYGFEDYVREKLAPYSDYSSAEDQMTAEQKRLAELAKKDPNAAEAVKSLAGEGWDVYNPKQITMRTGAPGGASLVNVMDAPGGFNTAAAVGAAQKDGSVEYTYLDENGNVIQDDAAASYIQIGKRFKKDAADIKAEREAAMARGEEDPQIDSYYTETIATYARPSLTTEQQKVVDSETKEVETTEKTPTTLRYSDGDGSTSSSSGTNELCSNLNNYACLRPTQAQTEDPSQLCEGCEIVETDNGPFIKFPTPEAGVEHHKRDLRAKLDPSANKSMSAPEVSIEDADGNIIRQPSYMYGRAEEIAANGDYESTEAALENYMDWATVADLIEVRTPRFSNLGDNSDEAVDNFISHLGDLANTPLSEFVDASGAVNEQMLDKLNDGIMSFETPKAYEAYKNAIGKGDKNEELRNKPDKELISQVTHSNVIDKVRNGGEISEKEVDEVLASENPKLKNISKNYKRDKKKFDELNNKKEELELDLAQAETESQKKNINRRLKKVGDELQKLGDLSPAAVGSALYSMELDAVTNAAYDQDIINLANDVVDGEPVFIEVDDRDFNLKYTPMGMTASYDAVKTLRYRINKLGSRYRVDQIDPETGKIKGIYFENRSFKLDGVDELKEWLNERAYNEGTISTGIRAGDVYKSRRIRPYEPTGDWTTGLNYGMWQARYIDRGEMIGDLDKSNTEAKNTANRAARERASEKQVNEIDEAIPTQGGASGKSAIPDYAK